MLLLCACWCPRRTMMSGTKKDSSTCCDIRSSNSVGNTRRGIKGLHASIGGKAGRGACGRLLSTLTLHHSSGYEQAHCKHG